MQERKRSTAVTLKVSLGAACCALVQARKFKHNSGLTYEEIAREYVGGGRAPGKLVQDVKINSWYIEKLLNDDPDTALVTHPVTRTYFRTKNAERRIAEATETMFLVADDKTKTQTRRQAAGVILSMLPSGRGKVAVGLRIIREAVHGRDMPYSQWCEIMRRNAVGKVARVKQRADNGRKQKILPASEARQLTLGIAGLLGE